jgi:hypothetical protein
MNTEEDELVSTKSKVRESTPFKYRGSPENFVFTLYPEKKFYRNTGENIFYVLQQENMLAFGGPAHSPALQLEEFLSSGLSFSSPTYNNPPLHRGPPG